MNQSNNSNQVSRLVLGTAQLGMPYGIANATGQPDFRTAQEIVKTAWENGICEFDTAEAYGQSERVLGHVFKNLGICKKVRVTSKPHPNLDHLDPEVMSNALQQTLERLHSQDLYCYMLHREELLDLWQEGLREILIGFVQKGLIKNIGISLYSPEKALRALDIEDITIIQIPTNVLDRRFERATVFERAEQLGKKIYIRSIFLQGFLLLNSDQLPSKLQFASRVAEELDILVKNLRMSKRDLALGYVKNTKPNAKIVFGAETPRQVEENIANWNKAFRPGMFQELKHSFCSVDERILNPALW